MAFLLVTRRLTCPPARFSTSATCRSPTWCRPAQPVPRRKPDDPRYKKLARGQPGQFGLVEPLVWNEATGHVVGDARLAICKGDGTVDVPVSVVRLSPEREKGPLNVVLNNQEAQGRYDPAKLVDLLDELSNLPELELTGFDAGDLRGLRLEPLEELPREEPPAGVELTLDDRRRDDEWSVPRLDALAGSSI